MYRKQFYTILTVILVICITSLSLGVGAARAQAPGNDDFDSAILIGALPFGDAQNTTEATLAGDDPMTACNSLMYDKTVWYSFTPGYDMGLNIRREGSDYRANVQVFTGSRGLLSRVAGNCDDWNYDLRFRADAGTTYYIMVAAAYYSWEPPTNGGNLVFNVTELPVPPNDNFANAAVITSLPFEESSNVEFASREPGEPVSMCGTPERSIWYAYMPGNSVNYTAYGAFEGEGKLAIFTGDTLSSLVEVACQNMYWGSQLSLQLEAGVTYFFRIGVSYAYWGWGQTFRLDLTPPPTIDYGFYPSDPGKFDTIWVQNYTSDPAGMPLSVLWDFGDGATSTEWSPAHRYAADGDYTVRLTATATDGRSNWAEKVIQVRTHDVAITRFTAPSSASVGQTRQITVFVNNKYYDETVEVILYKSTPGGYIQVGVLRLYVPVRPTSRTVPFAFSYTFSPEDAAMGKVTFKAVANLVNVRDALPADNEAISFPTKVAR